MMLKVVLAFILLTFAAVRFVSADDSAKTDEDARRQVATAEFARKMKEANYPALFEKAANEFNVPADILKAVSFAETRWDHLTWPPGEAVSPENGMPRPYGIMSLWDNQYFGHSLIEAAQLLGKDPEELKIDPFQNMRGGAALLRKIYDETPRPAGTSEADLESWRYAIRKYCGIPEPDLNAQHGLKVYIFMNQGYHGYGLEWDARPVNLETIREETRRIMAEETAKREAFQRTETNLPARLSGPGLNLPAATNKERSAVKGGGQMGLATSSEPQPAKTPTRRNAWWFISVGLAVAIGSFLFYRARSRKQSQSPR